MADYVIGDVQGCYDQLQRLLDVIQFNPEKDTLWFTGDLVNRGPNSLETLRFIKNLGNKHHIVLGNHDLHLLARAHQAHAGWPDDTLDAVLTASDLDELIAWLSCQPLLYHHPQLDFILVHAGLAPCWDLDMAKVLAKEVETQIQGSHAAKFFQHMYGNQPNFWNSNLQGFDRLRCITNYFTRMRYCYPDGTLELNNKGIPSDVKNVLLPWFKVPSRVNSHLKILFGHWAALGGDTDNTPNTFALDTGCIWGFELTAMRLPDLKRFCVTCR